MTTKIGAKQWKEEAAFAVAGLTFAGITDWWGVGTLLANAPRNQRADVSC
ncbi:MAG: hypothetical protein WD342_17175 [Verrucomicrobiales bacterium]